MSLPIIDSLGFRAEAGHDVTGRVSIADRFPASKSRCGIYLLQFSDGTFYIGQAVDAVRRFAQHRKNYDTIVRHWFQSVAQRQLDLVEQQLIRQAEAAGLLLTNKTFAINVVGDTDLDLLVSPAEQAAWLADGHSLDNEEMNLIAQGLAVEALAAIGKEDHQVDHGPVRLVEVVEHFQPGLFAHFCQRVQEGGLFGVEQVAI